MHDLEKGAQGGKKRAMLKDIRVGEVSLVGRGANEGALVALAKAADGGEDALLKQSFDEALMAMGMGEKAEQMLEEAYKMNHALRASLRSILADPKVSEKKAAIRESLAQFVSAMTSMVDDSDIIKALEKAAGKTEGGATFPAGDFAYAPDPAKPSAWKLRLTSSPGGPPDPRIVGAAVAALGPSGYRGNRVEIPANERAAAVARVRAAWLKANPGKGEKDLPETLKKSDNQEDNDMSKEQIDALNKKVDDLTARLTKSELRASMTDAQRAHYDGLEGAAQEAFGKADAAERDEIVKKASQADESLTVDGDTVRKSEVGEGVFRILKRQQERIDSEASVAKKERDERLQKDLEAEAEREFPNLAGTPVEKAAMLKAIKAMPKEQADKQMANLKSADTAMAKQLKELGVGGGEGEGSDAEAKLQKMAKERAEKDGTTIHKAYSAVLDTPEGAKLYEESLKRQ
jgi:hypothetical protein